MEKPGEAAIIRLRHDSFQPAELRLFFGLAAADQQRIEPDQAPTLDILDPAVGAEMVCPSRQPLGIDRLLAMTGIADIVVARQPSEPHPEPPHQPGAMPQVILAIRAIDGDIAGVDDKVGALGFDPCRQRRPVAGEMRFHGAQMGV